MPQNATLFNFNFDASIKLDVMYPKMRTELKKQDLPEITQKSHAARC